MNRFCRRFSAERIVAFRLRLSLTLSKWGSSPRPRFGVAFILLLVFLSVDRTAGADFHAAPGKLPNFDHRPGEKSNRLAPPPLPQPGRPGLAEIQTVDPALQVEFDEIVASPKFISKPGGFLTPPEPPPSPVAPASLDAPAAQDPHRVIKKFLQQHPALFGHGSEVLDSARVHRDYVAAGSGLRTVIWQQQVEGVRVFEAMLAGHLTRQQQLVNLSSRFVPQLEAAVGRGVANPAQLLANPPISAIEAIVRAARNTGDTVDVRQIHPRSDPSAGAERQQVYTAEPLKGDVRIRLTWVPMNRSTLRLAWQVELKSRAHAGLYRLLVDAQDGEIILRHSLTFQATPASYRVFLGDSPSPFSPGHSVPSGLQPPLVERQLVTWSALSTNASPHGWIEDGVNELRGNNVDAHLDRDDNDLPDLPRTTGFPDRVFDFGWDAVKSPTSFGDAAATQLFFWNNWIHDRLYDLGFTEEAGNFQNVNFDRGGVGKDAVQADAQDGGGFNNANFDASEDGVPGRMQMYLFDGPNPDRDGTLDVEIVIHEYVHGLSSRLVGGGVGITQLQTAGMGEGWSDFFAMCLLSESTDDLRGNYAFGGYATYQLDKLTQNYYFGIRRYPYSIELARNPLTFKDIDPRQTDAHSGVPRSPLFSSADQADEVHNQGEVWCVALWDVRANLIRKLGYEAGNQLMLQITTDGMKLSPPNPNFLQARDAILQAERARTGGLHQAELWEGFAKRGMGYSATSPRSSTTEGVVEAFDTPDDLLLTPNAIFTSRGSEAGPFLPASQLYSLSNGGTNRVVWAARKSAGWLDLSATNGVIPVGGEPASVAMFLNDTANDLPAGTYADTITFTNEVTGRSQSRRVILHVAQRDHFTQLFANEDNNLAYQSFTFTPDGSPSFYSVCREEVTEFPTDPSAATILTLEDLDGLKLTLAEGARLSLYGTPFDGFYVSESGYLTFTQPASDFYASIEAHFSAPRVSMLFDILDASEEGVISWIQMPDRVAVTFENVPNFFEANRNNFQVELFFDGRIRMTYLEVGTTGGLVGLSNGGGVPEDFLESQFRSYGACLPSLAMSLPASASESDGVLAGRVSIPEAVPRDLPVALTSLNPSRATVDASVIIPRGETSVEFSVRVADNSILDGTKVVGIAAASEGYREGHGRLLIDDNETAALSLQIPVEVREGDGLLAGKGTVTLSAPPAKGVVVVLSSSDVTEVRVPSVVVIPAGETSASFDLIVQDDLEIDGPMPARITAAVPHWTPGTALITVNDNERTELALKVRSVLGENNGLIKGAGVVWLAGSYPADLTVSLSSSDAASLQPLPSVVISRGQTNASFDLSVFDNPSVDGPRQVTLTARAEGFREAVFVTILNDDETPPQPVSPVPADRSANTPPNTGLAWSTGEGEILANGDFERGDLSGWTLEASGDGRFIINDGTVDPEGPELPAPPRTGRFEALSQQSGPGRYTLAQLITIAPGATSAKLVWSDRIHNHASFFVDPDQQFQVEIRSSEDQLLAIAYSTHQGDPLLNEWVQRSYDLADFIGQTIRIAFVVEARFSYLNVHLDEVSVELGKSGATTYDVYFGTNSIPTPAEFLGTTSSNGWTLPRLEIDQTYFWQVVAKRGDAKTLGPVWQFKVPGVGPLHHFSWDPVPSPQFIGTSFPVRLLAKDVFENTVAQYSGRVAIGARIDLADLLVGTGTNTWENPLGGFLPDSRCQVLYLPTEIGAARRITALALDLTKTGDTPLNNFTIRMKHSSLKSYSATPSWERLGWTTVYQRKQSLEDHGWVTFQLSTPFDYDGSSSLMVDFSFSGSDFGVGGEVRASEMKERRALVYNSFGFYGNPLTWSGTSSPVPDVHTQVPNVRFSSVNDFETSPAFAGDFINGVWSGGVTISQLATGLMLRAVDGEGHSGQGGPFSMQARDDLSLSGVHSPNPVTVGNSVTNLFLIANSGPSDSTGVVLTDKFSPGGTPLVGAVSQGTYTLTNSTLVWEVGTLAAGRNARIQFVLQQPASPRTITNEVRVVRQEPEAYLLNNSLLLTTVVLPVPALSVADVKLVEGDSGSTRCLFNVTLSVPSSQEVKVDYAATAGSAQALVDFTPDSGQLVFPPGSTQQTIAVEVIGDLVDEVNETFFLTLSSPANATLARPRATAEILDDDGPQILITDATIVEGDAGVSDAVFDVRLSQPSPQTVSVDYATATASAAAGVDFVSTSGTLRLSPGTTNASIKVPVRGDSTIEPNERFFLNLFNPTNAVLGDKQAIGTISNDDGLPGHLDHFEWDRISSPQLVNEPFVATVRARDAFGHPATNFTGQVRLSGEILRPEQSVGDGDSTWDEPISTLYEDSRTQIIYLAREVGAARPITGLALNVKSPPGLPLNRWTIRMKHTTLSSYGDTPTWDSSGWTLVYQNTETFPQSGWTWFEFSVPFNYDGTRNLLLDLSFNNADFEFDFAECAATDTSVSRAMWGASDSFEGDPLSWTGSAGDPVPRDQILNIRLSSRSPVSLTPVTTTAFADSGWTGNVTIRDLASGMNLRADDQRGHIGLSETFNVSVVNDLSVVGAPTPDPVTVGQPLTYTLTVLNSGPAASTGVLLSNVAPAGVTVVGAVSTQGSCTVSNGTTVCDLGTLPGGSNAIVSITCVSPSRSGVISARTEVFRTEPDPYPTNNVAVTRVQVNSQPLISARDASLYEGSSGTTNASILVILSVVSSQPVTVDYMVTNGSATAGSDFLPTSGTLVFPPGVTNQSIPVVVLSDTVDEQDESFQVRLSNPVHGTLARAQAAVTIVDDDGPVISASSVSVLEGDTGTNSVLFQVRLSAPSPQGISVQYRTVDGTATEGSDYTSVSGSLAFTPGVVSQTVKVLIRSDVTIEADETFLLSLFSPANATLAHAQAEATILNDDGLPGKVDHFEWLVEPAGLRAAQPFGAVVMAKDGSNDLVHAFAGTVTLRGSITNSDLSIGTGIDVSANPMDTSWDVSRVQTIYRAPEIGGARTLTALALNIVEAPDRVLNHWTIRLKHTTLNSYGTSSAWEGSGWTVVYQSDQSVDETGWVVFPFSRAFDFNGVSNLAVDFSFRNSNSGLRGPKCLTTTTNETRTLYLASFGFEGDPLAWVGRNPTPDLSYERPDIRLSSVTQVLIQPGQSERFSEGRWVGSLLLTRAVTNLVLRASDSLGHTGVSAPLTLLPWRDTDGDGIPDDWELASGFDSNNGTDAGGDADADGFTNRDEYLAGTDPRSANDALRIRLTWAGDQGGAISFQTVAGRLYQIESAADLSLGGWQVFQDRIYGTGQRMEWIVPDLVKASGRFYRVRLVSR